MKLYIRSNQNINASFDDDDDFMNGHKYMISAGTPGDYMGDYDEKLAEEVSKGYEVYYTDDPFEAIKTWFACEKRHRHDAAIQTNKKKYAQELIDCAAINIDEIEELAQTSGYKFSYLQNSIKSQYDNGTYFMENKWEYPDQVSPFSFG